MLDPKTKDKITVELQTNGTFSQSTRDWIAENVDVIWVSCDGEPYIQDKQRPFVNGKPTSSIVEENFKIPL